MQLVGKRIAPVIPIMNAGACSVIVGNIAVKHFLMKLFVDTVEKVARAAFYNYANRVGGNQMKLAFYCVVLPILRIF